MTEINRSLIQTLLAEKVNYEETQDTTDLAYNTAIDHCIAALKRHFASQSSEIPLLTPGSLGSAELANYLYEATNTDGEDLDCHLKAVLKIMRPYLRTTEPVSGRGASCDDPRTIKVSETMALIPPDGVNPRTPSLPPEQPVESSVMLDALTWLHSALNCKEWHWDADQKEAAQWCYDEAMKKLASLPKRESGN